jgi:hypothetical protein
MGNRKLDKEMKSIIIEWSFFGVFAIELLVANNHIR